MITGVGRGIDYAGGFLVPKAKEKEKQEEGSFKDTFLSAAGSNNRIRYREVSSEEKKVPYSQLAKDGIIEYKGVVFVCDYEENALCLGDMSNPDEVLSIPLSEGGTLKVNRDNIDSLASAIGMFSPEDVNRILRAIAEDAQCSRKLNEIEEMKNETGIIQKENS